MRRMKKAIVIIFIIITIVITTTGLKASSSYSSYYWLNCYYSNDSWDTVTDFLLLEDKIITIGKTGRPYGSTIDTVLTNSGASIIEMAYDGKVEKLIILSNKKYIEKEDAIFLYRIFKETDGYLLFAGSNISPYRDRFSGGDNGFNKFYVIKISPDYKKIIFFKAYYSPAIDLRDVVYFRGFYYVLLYDITRNHKGIAALLKINKEGEIISAKKFYLSDYQIRGLLVASESKVFLIGELVYLPGLASDDELVIAEINPDTLQIQSIKSYGKKVTSIGKGIIKDNKILVPIVYYEPTATGNYHLEIVTFDFESRIVEEKRIISLKSFIDVENLDNFGEDYFLSYVDQTDNHLIIKVDSAIEKVRKKVRIGPYYENGWIVGLKKKGDDLVFSYPILFPAHNSPYINNAVNDFVIGKVNSELEMPYGENNWFYTIFDNNEIKKIENIKIKETETAKKISITDLQPPSISPPEVEIFEFPGESVKVEKLASSKFRINYFLSPGGTISPLDSLFNYGETVTYRFLPDEGYKIKDVIVDGVSVGAVTSYTFENIDRDHELKVIFESNKFQISTIFSNGGRIYPINPEVIYGNSITLSIVPEEGYEIEEVKVDGKSIGVVSTYTFENVKENHTLEVRFKRKLVEIKVNITPPEGGRVFPEIFFVEFGRDATYLFIPAQGYEIEEVKVDGKSLGKIEIFTFEKLKENHTLEVRFKRKLVEIKVNITPPQGGRVSPDIRLVEYGNSITYQFIPNEGYEIENVLLNDKSLGPISGYTISNITSSLTLEVKFRKKRVYIYLTIGSKLIYVNSTPQEIDVPPQIVEGRTLLPIRWVAEPLGATVLWDSTEKKVTIVFKDILIELWIGKNLAKVNGNYKLIDPNNPKVVPMIIEGRTMLPVRFVAENLGCKVDWDPNTKTVTITYPKD